MKAVPNNDYIGVCSCKSCGADLYVQRGDLRIKHSGPFHLVEIAYITCPICLTELTIGDNDLWRFGLQRGE